MSKSSKPFVYLGHRIYKYHWVLKHFQKYALVNSSLLSLSLSLRYYEISRKEEIYSYITIIIRVLGNLIHKYINNFKVIRNFRQRYIEQTTQLTKIHYIPVLLNKLQKVEGNLKRFLISSLVVCILATHGDSGDSISSRNKILFLCYSYRHMWPFCSSLCRIHNRTCEIVRETSQSNSIKHLELNKWLR